MPFTMYQSSKRRPLLCTGWEGLQLHMFSITPGFCLVQGMRHAWHVHRALSQYKGAILIEPSAKWKNHEEIMRKYADVALQWTTAGSYHTRKKYIWVNVVQVKCVSRTEGKGRNLSPGGNTGHRGQGHPVGVLVGSGECT